MVCMIEFKASRAQFKIWKADNSLFYFRNRDVTMYISLYVDIIIVTTS
jgi:hypothetical protein